MSQILEGGCFCKAVRYRLTADPTFVHCCHCLNCQSQTGSAFVLNAIIETEAIELVFGEFVVTELGSGDGRPHDIHRCSRCQVAVWSDYGRRPRIRFVRVGTLEEKTTLSPGVHIYTRSRQPWIALPAGIPAYEEFYDPRKVWPLESLARWRAASRRPGSPPRGA